MTTPHQTGTPDLRSLGDILDAVQNAGHKDKTAVEDILTAVGTRSFAPIILIPALILISPLSGIFGLSTIGAMFILLITVQKLIGRAHVWMPGIITRRKVATTRVTSAVKWLRKPCNFIDRHTHQRLSLLTSRPSNVVTLLTIVAITLIIPFLEVLPMVTSIFATAISFFAIALLARDGVFTLLGYIWVGFSLTAIYWLIGG